MAKGTLDSNGLSIPTFEEIQRDNAVAIQDGVGRPIDTSDNSIAGVLNTLVSASQTDTYELIQAIYSSFDINQATGVQLDRLGLNRNIRRNPQTATTGSLYFKVKYTDQPFTVPVNTICSDGDYNYLTSSNLFISSSNTTILEAAILDNGSGEAESNTYTVLIANISKTINKQAGNTPEDIVDAFVTAIQSDTRYDGVVTVSKVNDNQDRPWILKIESSTTQNIQIEWLAGSLNTANSYVSASVSASNLTAGAISAVANTITSLVTPFNISVQVNNPFALSTGTERETDEEYRIRLLSSNSSSGVGTLDAINTALDNIPSTTSINVKENFYTETDVDGLPPKSFQVIVQSSATNDEIAQVIWDTKPVGIRPYGQETGVAKDRFGAEHTMYFDRPVSVSYRLEIDWSTEQTLDPAVVSQTNIAIQEAVNTLAGGIDVARDISPSYFYSAIYNASRNVTFATVRLYDTNNTEQSKICIADAEIAAITQVDVTQIAHSC